MEKMLLVTHIVVSILLVISILIQEKAGGLSAAIGGAAQDIPTTKRGAEKLLETITVILALVYIATAIGFMMIR